jgi:hypothetical protein
MRCDSRASLLAHTLVSLCLVREPKARVATSHISILVNHDEVYVINKHVFVNVFGVCAKGYVKDLKRQISKTLTL